MFKRHVFLNFALFFLAFIYAAPGSAADDGKLSESAWQSMLKAPAMGDHAMGKADAPVTIVAYASLTCSHCADFYNKVLPKLKEKYIDPGKVRLIFRGYTLNPLDTAAQMLTRCAGDEKYFPLVSAFYSTQASWTMAKDPVAALLQVSRQAGFTQESFENCLRNQKLLDEINAVREKAGKDFGVNSTPNFFINGEAHRGELPFDEFEKLLQAHLKS